MNHEDLVNRAFRWLFSTAKCSVVLTEMQAGSEIPDAIGWCGWGTILIECKVSISDLKRDKIKSFRNPNDEDSGMGQKRYYLIPTDIFEESLLYIPPKWGILVCRKTSVWVHRESEIFERSVNHETLLLISIIRRIAGSSPDLKKVAYVKFYTDLLRMREEERGHPMPEPTPQVFALPDSINPN